MPNQIFEMQLSDTPDYLLREISGVIHSLSTPLIKIVQKNKTKEKLVLIGSGTFVTIQGIYGILTAHHVAEQLELGCSLGIVLIPGEHRNTTNFQYLEIVNIARGLIDSEGPDLAFIILPDAKVSEIKPYKHFHNLDTDLDRMLNTPLDTHNGIWFICGVLDERTKEETSHKGFGQITSLEGTCSAVGVDRLYKQGNFDYIEIDVEYDKGFDIPKTFGGISGGGLWQVTIKKHPNEKLEPVSYFLSGVAFYQSDIKGSKRFIKCHSRKSIYKNVYDKICEAYPKHK